MSGSPTSFPTPALIGLMYFQCTDVLCFFVSRPHISPCVNLIVCQSFSDIFHTIRDARLCFPSTLFLSIFPVGL